MDAQITHAFIDLVLATTTLVGGFLVAWIRKHVSLHNIELAQTIARVAVQAAEQLGIGAPGEVRLQHALDAAHSLAGKHGVNLSDNQWRALIEAEVLKLKAYGMALTVPDDAAPEAPPAPVGPSAQEIAAGVLQDAINKLVPPAAPAPDVAGQSA